MIYPHSGPMNVKWYQRLLQSVEVPSSLPQVFERCELARELKERHKIPAKELATWVCIARYESEFNSSAVGRLNGDGSEDHGIFQISDKYWCSPPGEGYACAISCSSLEDDDLADDVKCAKRIKRAHDRVSGGKGFSAWAVYGHHCSGPQEALEKKFTADCFTDNKAGNTTTTAEPLITSRLIWPSYYYMTHTTHPQYWYLSTPLNSLYQPYVLG
ncbi:lysozyme C, milk isozyme-like [Hetaerina americana]|uniref:lysozyme C, milk isozyme-like n=1 Tax=Hetaerina americana TaxID=62018 RepID=UPI003A7F2785